MSGHSVVIDLLAAVALLLWATRLVRTGMERALREKLRRAIHHATRNRLSAWATGVCVATALQSSTATALILSAFTRRGMVPLGAALALMLGADLGSSFVVQALSFDLGALAPLLLVAGVGFFMSAGSGLPRHLGRILIGLALMLMALGMISAASAPLRDDPLLQSVLQRLEDEAMIVFALGAVLTWLAHSSVATILLVLSLAADGVIAPALGLTLVLGANAGAGLVPLGLAARAGTETRRFLLGNLLFRLVGGLAALPLVAPALALGEGADVARLLANAHTAFNLGLGVVFLPFTGVMAAALERLLADPREPLLESRASLMDPAALDRPRIALSGAAREALRLAETVEQMLREAIHPFHEPDGDRREEIRRLDAVVDQSCEEILRYLTALTQRDLSQSESREVFDLILFTTNLEHVGDIIDKNLLALAQKKQRLNVSFSDEGWRELSRMHALALEQFRMAIGVFVTRDLDMARELVRAKDKFRAMELEGTENHLRRLREGTAESIETSSLHMDMQRDIKRIIAHVTAVAYPILEAVGELKGSRLAPAGARRRA